MGGDHASRDGEASYSVLTEEDFQRALRRVVLEADSNGIDVRGAWPVFVADDGRGWDLEITEVV